MLLSHRVLSMLGRWICFTYFTDNERSTFYGWCYIRECVYKSEEESFGIHTGRSEDSFPERRLGLVKGGENVRDRRSVTARFRCRVKSTGNFWNNLHPPRSPDHIKVENDIWTIALRFIRPNHYQYERGRIFVVRNYRYAFHKVVLSAA